MSFTIFFNGYFHVCSNTIYIVSGKMALYMYLLSYRVFAKEWTVKEMAYISYNNAFSDIFVFFFAGKEAT